jgi:hypothetical protein
MEIKGSPDMHKEETNVNPGLAVVHLVKMGGFPIFVAGCPTSAVDATK